jgi:hypothetical protein
VQADGKLGKAAVGGGVEELGEGGGGHPRCWNAKARRRMKDGLAGSDGSRSGKVARVNAAETGTGHERTRKWRERAESVTA